MGEVFVMIDELNGTDDKKTDESTGASFADLFEESLKGLKEGEVIKGTVVEIVQGNVYVDIGFKSEGIIPLAEFSGDREYAEIKPGDSVEVFLVKQENKDGKPVLSRQRARGLKTWDVIEEALESSKPLEGRITNVVKGGFFVDIDGVRAFLPGSQVGLRPVRDMESLVGKVYEFRILKAEKAKNNVIVSRRALLDEERQKSREETIGKINEGDQVKGIVKNITNYGAFIDVGGVDGLLHITDMSWGRINHPNELLNVGDEVDVVILKFDREKMRLTLGMKQLTPDPWLVAAQKYAVGSKTTGKVVSLMDYGAFVELEEGFEGLVHISEMSWTKKIKHPSQVVNVGDTVEVMILDINRENRRISLGLKQVEPNPWDVVEEKYPVGTKIKGKVKDITDFGIFVGFDEGIDGLVHISDVSWTKKIGHPSELFNKGDEIEAIVLGIEKEKEKFSLGIKQLEENPWDAAKRKFTKGTVATGKVTSVTDFGIFIELEEGLEGLIRSTEFGSKGEGNPKDLFKVGEDVTAEVIRINNKERRISLSIKAYERSTEKEALKNYAKQQGDQTATLGDIIGKELKGKAGKDTKD